VVTGSELQAYDRLVGLRNPISGRPYERTQAWRANFAMSIFSSSQPVMRDFLCLKKARFRVLFNSFTMRFVAKRHILAKVFERTNRNLPARNTLVQCLAL